MQQTISVFPKLLVTIEGTWEPDEGSYQINARMRGKQTDHMKAQESEKTIVKLVVCTKKEF